MSDVKVSSWIPSPPATQARAPLHARTLCPPLSPPPRWHPGPLRLPKPNPALAPRSGAGAAAEFRWNFEVGKHLGGGREGVEAGKKVRFWRQLAGRERAPRPGGGRRVPPQDAGGRRAGGVPANPRGVPRGAPGAGAGAVLTYICIAKRLLRVHRGAAAGVGPAEHRPHQQEAERERQAAGRGAHGGRGRGPGARARGSAAAAWVRGASSWADWGARSRCAPGRALHARPALARTNFLGPVSRGRRGDGGGAADERRRKAGGRRGARRGAGPSSASSRAVCAAGSAGPAL